MQQIQMQCLAGVTETSSNFVWTYFTIGNPQLKPPYIQSYYEAGKEWKFFLNPKREAFQTVFERATSAFVKRHLSLSGKVLSKEAELKTSMQLLDDPCARKIVFSLYNSSPEDVVDTLQTEFSAKEAYTFGCPQGILYSVEERRYVTQNGPPFTRMLSPLLYYRQGGAKKSGRKAIVKAESRRYLEGYQTRLKTKERIQEKMCEFFQGENFYLYQNTCDPLSDRFCLRSLLVKRFPKKICWFSGGSSESLLTTFHMHLCDRPAHIPKGILLQNNLLPMGGTLDDGIKRPGGINWWALSGYGPKHAQGVFRYTKSSGFSLETEKNIIHSLSSQLEGTTRFLSQKNFGLLIRAKIAVLRIAYLGAQENRELALSDLKILLDKLPSFPPVDQSWKRYLPLLGKIVPEQHCSTKQILAGTIVVGARYNGKTRFGLVLHGTHTISVNWGREWKDSLCGIEEVIPISRDQLETYRMIPSYNQITRVEIERHMVGPSVDDWVNFVPWIGSPVPVSKFVNDAMIQPGKVCGVFSKKNGEYVYTILSEVLIEECSAMKRSGNVYSIQLPNYRQFISIPTEALEAEVCKYPPMADTEVLEKKIEERLKTPRQRVEDMINVLQITTPLKLSAEEEGFITHPFPIVWGSTTVPKLYVNGEQLLNGCQLLGSDIPVVYTDEAHIEQLQTYIDAHMPPDLHVEVLPFSELPSK